MESTKIEFTREKFDKRLEEMKKSKEFSKEDMNGRSFSVKKISSAWGAYCKKEEYVMDYTVREVPVTLKYEAYSPIHQRIIQELKKDSEVKRGLLEKIKKHPLHQILTERMGVYGIKDLCTEEVLCLISLAADGNPGRAMLLLIDLVNEREHLGEKINLDVFLTILYPKGVFTLETCQKIVDNYVKKGLVKHSEIYFLRW